MAIIGVCRHGLWGNLFSTGMDELAVLLNQHTPNDTHFTVSGGDDPRIDEDEFDAGLFHHLAQGDDVIYIGHSLAADASVRFSVKCADLGYKLPLIGAIDPVSWDSNAAAFLPGHWEVRDNVKRVLCYRSVTFPGEGVVFRAAGNTVTDVVDTQLDLPHAVANPPGGADIANSPIVHAALLKAVLQVVRDQSNGG